MVMSISNYSGTADEFEFPHNPNTFDDSLNSNHTFTNIAYQRHHILVSGGGINPLNIILNGHMDGANKLTDYRSLRKHFQETTKLKKLYFETDKFYLGIGQQIKKTNTGGRTNFIDYIASFQTIIGILLDDTQQTYTNGGAHVTNDGDVTTFVEEIKGDVTSGASDVTVTDALGNSLKIPAASLTTGQEVVISFVKMVDSGSGIYVTEYNYCTVVGTQIRTVQTTGGFGLIQLIAGASTSGLTITNLDVGYTVKFRNGWSG